MNKIALAPVPGQKDFDQIRVELVNTQVVKVILYQGGETLPADACIIDQASAPALHGPTGELYYLLGAELKLELFDDDHVSFRICEQGFMYCAP